MRRFAVAALHNSFSNCAVSGWLEEKISRISELVANDEFAPPRANISAPPRMDGRNTRSVSPKIWNQTRVATLRLNSNADQNSSFLSTTSGTPKIQANAK